MIYSRFILSRYYLLFNGLLSLFILLSCDSSPQLNSERIAARYGNYGIEILSANEHRRVANLYSDDGTRKTMRTLALVVFTATDQPETRDEHARILAGGSIGAVFKEAGWTIEKVSSRYCLSRSDLESMPQLAHMHIDLPASLATRSYVFGVRKDGKSIDYATITEIHHPDYLQASDFANANLDEC